jgi:hypothetical protein
MKGCRTEFRYKVSKCARDGRVRSHAVEVRFIGEGRLCEGMERAWLLVQVLGDVEVQELT